MAEKAIKKDKPKYTMAENTMYLIKNMWKWDRGIFLFFLLQIPLMVLGPFLGIYMPKVLVDSIEQGVGLNRFLIKVGLPIIGIIIVGTLLRAFDFKTQVGGLGYRLRYTQKLIDKTVDTDFENIDGPQGQDKFTKALMSTLGDHSATQAIIDVLVQLCSNLLGIVLYGGIILTIHPLFIVFIVISSMINYFAGNHANKFEYKNKDNLSPIQKKEEYIRTKAGDFEAAKDLRLYNMTSWFQDMYNIIIKDRINIEKQNTYRKYLANLVDGLLAFLRDGMAYGFLIYSVLYRDMAIGNFVLYFGAIGGFSNWISGIIQDINDLNRVHLDTSDLREYFDMEDKMNRGVGVDLPKSWELPIDIELRNLYYKYPGAEDYAIKDFNLHIRKGEKLALVGVNGAGKTTLVKLICGLYRPTKGQIYINGKKSSDYNRDDYYTLFSVVFQDIHLLPMSIEENISLQIKEDMDSEKIDRVLELSGLKEKIDSLDKGRETMLLKSVYKEAIDLSGGEMQKLVLAQALYKDSPIIILDEPTAALDPIAENEIYERYNELVEEKTSVFISHRLSSTRFCDRIIFIEDGELIEEGNHKELMSRNGKYREMYDMQSHYYKKDIRGENIG